MTLSMRLIYKPGKLHMRRLSIEMCMIGGDPGIGIVKDVKTD